MDDDTATLVIDNGSGIIKAGFVGYDEPHSVFNSVVGLPLGVITGQKYSYVGDDALNRRDTLLLNYPIANGSIYNWDNMERIWRHAFYDELCVTPEDHPLLLTEVALTPKSHREKMAQIMFETFNVPALYVAETGLLSALSNCITTAVSLSIGDTVTEVVPILDHQVVANATQRCNIGGRDLTEYMTRLLQTERGYIFTTAAERETVRDIKEKHCYVSLDFETELAAKSSAQEKTYELEEYFEFSRIRDRSITLEKERFRVPEALFQPAMVGVDGVGIHEMLYQSIMKCDADRREELFGNIVVSGGTSLLPGMIDRLQQEIVRLAPSTMTVNIIAPPERKYSAWIGGSTLGSIPFFPSMLVSKQEYNECGPSIVHRSYRLEYNDANCTLFLQKN